jgi:hypothetical protein
MDIHQTQNAGRQVCKRGHDNRPRRPWAAGCSVGQWTGGRWDTVGSGPGGSGDMWAWEKG